MAHTLGNIERIPSVTSTTLNTNPVTGSFAPGAGATVMVMMLAYAGTTARGGGAPTFAGSALQQADAQRFGLTSGECSAELWYMLAPPTSGSYAVSVPNSGTLALSIDLASGQAGTGYTSALDATSGSANSGATANPYTIITTTVGNTIIFGISADGAQNYNPSAVSGSFIWERDNGAWGESSQYDLRAASGAITVSWTFATGEDWGVVAAAFKEIAGLSTLSPQDATHTQTADNIVIIQHYGPLTVQTASQAQSAENTVLSFGFTLDIQDVQHIHSAGNIALTYHAPFYTLTLDDSIQVQSVNNVDLLQHYISAVSDSTHAQSAESPVLSFGFTLGMQDAQHIHSADNISLTQHGLGVPIPVAMSHYRKLRSK